MTDIADLVKRLREWQSQLVLCGYAADALDHQSREIASLESRNAQQARTIAEMCQQIADLGAQLARASSAVRFAGMVLKEHRNDGYPGDVDGAFLQETALECGLIEERIVSEPCGEMCTCAEVTNFPTQCYFDTESGRAAIALSQSQTSEGGA